VVQSPWRQSAVCIWQQWREKYTIMYNLQTYSTDANDIWQALAVVFNNLSFCDKYYDDSPSCGRTWYWWADQQSIWDLAVGQDLTPGKYSTNKYVTLTIHNTVQDTVHCHRLLQRHSSENQSTLFLLHYNTEYNTFSPTVYWLPMFKARRLEIWSFLLMLESSELNLKTALLY